MTAVPHWTEAELQAISRAIDEFDQAAFGNVMKPSDRKKIMKFIAQSCADRNIAHILGRSVDSLAKHPEWVRREIGLARQHLAQLRSGIES